MRRSPETKEEIEMTNRLKLTINRIKFYGNLNQSEIAERMGIGQPSLSEMICGARICTNKTLQRATEVMNELREKWIADTGGDDFDEAFEKEQASAIETAGIVIAPAEDYKTKYEELLAKYQSLVEDYQKLVNKMMGLN